MEKQQIDLTFLALTVWREASGELFEGKLAVAWSIMNRVRNPGWWGNDVLSVVFKKWQYSSMTAKGDPNLIRWPMSPTDESWLDCQKAAEKAYDAQGDDPTHGAVNYYDDSIAPPSWATSGQFALTVEIGKLNFYRKV